LQFLAATHILRTNFVEITTDGPVQSAYEIFDIKHRFKRSKSRSHRFKVACAQGHQIWVPPKNFLFYHCWLCETGYTLWRVQIKELHGNWYNGPR